PPTPPATHLVSCNECNASSINSTQYTGLNSLTQNKTGRDNSSSSRPGHWLLLLKRFSAEPYLPQVQPLGGQQGKPQLQPLALPLGPVVVVLPPLVPGVP